MMPLLLRLSLLMLLLPAVGLADDADMRQTPDAPPAISPEDQRVIEVLDILELMDLVEYMQLLQDTTQLAEGDDDAENN